jgi:hypothetical protein
MDVQWRPGLAIRSVDGEVVILDRDTEKIHQLNSTASFVWNRLESTSDLAQIARELSGEFDVEVDAALVDVGRIVGELQKLRLLVPSTQV